MIIVNILSSVDVIGKNNYQRRKNYDVIKRVVYDLVSDGFPVLVTPDGSTDPHPLLKIIEIPYKEYPAIIT